MKKQKAPRLVTVAILTTVTLIFWVFFSLYNVLTSKPPNNIDPKLLEPLNPSLDRDTLGKLENRIFFEERDVDFTISPSITITNPTSGSIETEEESPSPTPILTEEITPQGGQ